MSVRVPACALLILSACQTPLATDEAGATDTDHATSGTGSSPTDSASDTGAPDTTQQPTTGEPTTIDPTTQGPDDTTGTTGELDTTGTTTDTTGPVVNPGCDRDGVVLGDLVITDATDLESLACVVELHGDLRVEHTATLTSFPQLANMKRVLGRIDIEDNAALVDLAGLAGLERVQGPGPGWIQIEQNPALVDITGLAALEQLDGVYIAHCDALTDLTGLHGAITGSDAPGWSLSIADNKSLASLAPLAALDDFTGGLYLAGLPEVTDLSPLAEFLTAELTGLTVSTLPKLTDLQGLEAVTAVQSLDIIANPGLSDLTGLDGLQTVGAQFNLRDNAGLTSLDGLQSFTQAYQFTVEGNPELADLTALAGLKSVEYLQLGYCGEQGNDALVTLAGLAGLTHLDSLAINQNDALVDMSAIPHGIGLKFLEGFNNPKLPTAMLQTYFAETSLTDEWLCNNAGAPAVCECIFIETP